MMKIKNIITTLLLSTLCLTANIQIIQNSANVIAVDTKGTSGSYNFYVTLLSDETGCNQYANWWEILDENGNLLYRRILVHSHPDDQPFRRGGRRVNVTPSQTLYIRAHMNTSAYNGDVFKGSVSHGFIKSEDSIKNSSIVESLAPQPNGCLF